MAKVKLERSIIDPNASPDGAVGVYACDDGTVEVVLQVDGHKLTATMTPDEFDFQFAVGGIRMGVLARMAGEAARQRIEVVRTQREGPSQEEGRRLEGLLAVAAANGSGGGGARAARRRGGRN
jgi:hypothetical protein